MKKIFTRHDLFLAILLSGFVIIIGFINPSFLSIGTLFDVLRNQTVYILLAFALLPVVILGGFDISFVAIAAFATYPAILILTQFGYAGGMWLFYTLWQWVLVSQPDVNGWLIWTFKLAIFDFSLGMSSVIFGLLTLSSGSRSTSLPLPGFGRLEQEVACYCSIRGGSVKSSCFISTDHFAYSSLYLYFYAIQQAADIFTHWEATNPLQYGQALTEKNIYLIVFAIMGALAAIAGATNSGLGFGKCDFCRKVYESLCHGHYRRWLQSMVAKDSVFGITYWAYCLLV